MNKKKALRYVRWVFFAFMAVMLLRFAARYDFDRIPEGYHHLTPLNMPPGQMVLMTDCDDETVIGVGSIVTYSPDAEAYRRYIRAVSGQSAADDVDVGDQVLFGVVAGVPGEVVSFEGEVDGMVSVQIGDRHERLFLPRGHRLPAGPIPEGHYLILDGDRQLRIDAAGFDGRFQGVVPRSALRSKVAVHPMSFLL